MNKRIEKIVEGLKAGKGRSPRRDQIKKAIEENAFTYFIYRGYDEVYSVEPQKISATIENIESYWLNNGDFLHPQLLENGTKLVITIKYGYSYMELWADLTQETQPVEKIKEIKEVPVTQTFSNSDIKVIFNSEKNGVELYFTEKPVAELRNKLKESGFRYHSQKVCWYAKDTEEIINLLINENILIVEPEEVAEIKEMNISIDELNEISIIENVEVIEDNENKINNNEVKEVENMNSLELRKYDFGYCTDYKEGDNCKKCSELTKAKGYTGCVYATRKENIKTIQEVSIVEELKQESETVINSINTESLETQKASLKAVSNQLDKIYNAIEENLDNEEIRLKLRDIENELKYHYSSLHEMVEDQTMPDANDFNNIETLKTVYITNWNELPEELQNYILSCDKYWIDLQWINLYKDNRIVASIGISGHHKHDIEINSIGASELFQWNSTDGYTLNNLEVSVDKQENKIKVTHNEYENIAKELASRIYAKDETKISYSEYEKLLDNYEILPFEINTDNEELKKIINLYADNETKEENRTIYRGLINKSVLYNLYQNSDYKYLYNEYYQLIICKDDLKVILTYCEGDFIAEIYNSIESYNKGIERTNNFIIENLA